MADRTNDFRINTDSKYSIDCLHWYRNKWKFNNGMTVNNKQVENFDLVKDIVIKLDSIRAERNNSRIACIRHVKAHVGITGNERADQLAKDAIEIHVNV